MKEARLPRIKSYCHRCHGDTNHEIICSYKKKDYDDHYWEEVTYSIIRCCGCESVSFLRETMNPDTIIIDEDGKGEANPIIDIYPFQEDWL